MHAQLVNSKLFNLLSLTEHGKRHLHGPILSGHSLGVSQCFVLLFQCHFEDRLAMQNISNIANKLIK